DGGVGTARVSARAVTGQGRGAAPAASETGPTRQRSPRPRWRSRRRVTAPHPRDPVRAVELPLRRLVPATASLSRRHRGGQFSRHGGGGRPRRRTHRNYTALVNRLLRDIRVAGRTGSAAGDAVNGTENRCGRGGFAFGAKRPTRRLTSVTAGVPLHSIGVRVTVLPHPPPIHDRGT